jgi:hypothetical protein
MTILHGTAFVFLKYPYSMIHVTMILERTSLVMASVIAVILTTIVLAFAMPNQAFGCPEGCVKTLFGCACFGAHLPQLPPQIAAHLNHLPPQIAAHLNHLSPQISAHLPHPK